MNYVVKRCDDERWVNYVLELGLDNFDHKYCGKRMLCGNMCTYFNDTEGYIEDGCKLITLDEREKMKK